MTSLALGARLQATLEHRGQLQTEESHRQLQQQPQPLQQRGRVLQGFTVRPLATLDCGCTCMPCSGKDQGCHWVTSTDSGLTCSVVTVQLRVHRGLVAHLDHVINAVAGEEVGLDGGEVGELGGWGVADELVADREHLHD